MLWCCLRVNIYLYICQMYNGNVYTQSRNKNMKTIYPVYGLTQYLCKYTVGQTVCLYTSVKNENSKATYSIHSADAWQVNTHRQRDSTALASLHLRAYWMIPWVGQTRFYISTRSAHVILWTSIPCMNCKYFNKTSQLCLCKLHSLKRHHLESSNRTRCLEVDYHVPQHACQTPIIWLMLSLWTHWVIIGRIEGLFMLLPHELRSCGVDPNLIAL